MKFNDGRPLKSTRNGRPAKKPTSSRRCSLGVEALETRINPTDLVISPLLFRGDLVADGDFWKAIGKPVDVGFQPTQGEAFRKLVRLDGDSIINSLNGSLQFRGRATFSGAQAQVEFFRTSSLTTFDIQDMVGQGQSLTGQPLAWGDLAIQPTTFSLDNPDGGSTIDTRVLLAGSGWLSFGDATNGTKPGAPFSLTEVKASITPEGTGQTSALATGDLWASGTKWNFSNSTLASTLENWQSTTTILGHAAVTIRTDILDATISDATPIEITRGTLTRLEASLKGPFTIAGYPGTVDGTIVYTIPSGSGSRSSLAFQGSGTSEILSKLTYTQLAFTVVDNALTDFTSAKVDLIPGWIARLVPAPLTLIGLNARLELTSKLLFDSVTGKESLSITGQAGFIYDNLATDPMDSFSKSLFITLAGDGLVFRDGELQDGQIQLDGRFDLGEFMPKNPDVPGSKDKDKRWTFEARGLTIFWKDQGSTVGGFGSVFFAIDGFKEFQKTGATKPSYREPANYLEFVAGTSEEQPGLLFVDGRLQKLDLNLSTKDGATNSDQKPILTLGGTTWRINELGIIYQANATDGAFGKLALYGNIAVNTRKSSLPKSEITKDGTGQALENILTLPGGDQGGALGINLGTRAQPALTIERKWSDAFNRFITDFQADNLGIRLSGLYLGPLRIAEAEFVFSSNETDGFRVDKVALSLGMSGLLVGGTVKFKDQVDESTGISRRVVDTILVKFGVDFGANKVDSNFKGIPVMTGVYLAQLEGGIEGLYDPDNLIIRASATFIVGEVFKTGWVGVQNTNVYTCILRGQVAITLARGGGLSFKRVDGQVDTSFACYWDEANYTAMNEPWKPLAGQATGTFVYDQTKQFFEVTVTGKFFQALSFNGILKHNWKDDSFVLYLDARFKPDPYGILDWWPVYLLDISVAALYLKTSQDHIFGTWFDVDLGLFTAAGSLTVDINRAKTSNSFLDAIDFSWGTEGGKKLLQLKDATLNPSSEFKTTQTFTVTADKDSAELAASRLRVTIPYNSATIKIGTTTFASVLKDGDIAIEIPGSASGEANTLPDGASYTWTVSQNPADANGFVSGMIVVDIFPNLKQAVDLTKSFADLVGNQKLILDVRVKLKQNSMFAGVEGAAGTTLLQKILENPEQYLKGIDVSAQGASRYAKAVWDSSKRITIGTIDYPITPTQNAFAFVLQPWARFTNDQFVTHEINSYTNQTSFSYNGRFTTDTLSKGSVSLMVVDASDVLASLWTVQQESDWTTLKGQGINAASGFLVERQEFDPFEIRARKAETPYAGGNDTAGNDVLYFDSSGSIGIGRISSTTQSQVILQTSIGAEVRVGRDAVKLLWKPLTRVELVTPATEQPLTTTWQVFTAQSQGGWNPSATGSLSTLEAFRPIDRVNLGVMPAILPESLPREAVVLPTLPSNVAPSKNSSSYPINAALGLKTMPPGFSVPVTAVSATPVQGDSYFTFDSLGVKASPYLQNNTLQITWLEKSLTPTPKYAYLVINDGINKPVYSDLFRFEPSTDVAGKVLLDTGEGGAVPCSGLTVYVDTNGNGTLDTIEPFQDTNQNGQFDAGETFDDLNGNGQRDTLSEETTLTNTDGSYYFYGVAAGKNQIGFVLPGNRAPVSGSGTIAINHAAGLLTQVPDFLVHAVYPVVRGRLVADSNQNGIADPWEKGVSQAMLIASNASGSNSFVGYTDSEGYYAISLEDNSFAGTVTLAIAGGALDKNLAITSTMPGKGTLSISNVDFEKPRVFDNYDFLVQTNYTFQFAQNENFFVNILNYLNLFLDGSYTGITIKTSGFEFSFDRFKLLSFDPNEQGLESAKGRAVFAGQTLNFEFVGTRGLVASGLSLKEVNLRLSGNLDIFGARLTLDNLTGRYIAGNRELGIPGSFQLTGSTSLEIGGNKVTASLPGTGLVLSDRGIESLNVRLAGVLKVGGQDLDLGSLSAAYNRETDRLTLTGATQLLTLSSVEAGATFGLQNVVLVIAGGRVVTLQARVAGALDLQGGSFSLDNLTFAYLADRDSIALTGNSTLLLGTSRLDVSLPAPGITLSPAGIEVKGLVSGETELGGTVLELKRLNLDYTQEALRISGLARAIVQETPVALARMDLRFSQGEFRSLEAAAAGQLDVAGAQLSLDNALFLYDRPNQTIRIEGAATLSLISNGTTQGENSKVDRLLGISGAISLVAGVVDGIDASITSGVLSIAGASMSLQSLGLAYQRENGLFSLFGSTTLSLLGGTLNAAVPAPGIVWRNGRFNSIRFSLAGELPIQKDTQGNTAIGLLVDTLAANYSDSEARLTLKGNAGLRAGANVGRLETDSTGIVIVANRLSNFSAFLTLNLGFGGESFTDTNGNLVWNKGESFTDANGNGRYDAGMSLNFARAGFSYAAASPNNPSRLQVSGQGSLDFDGSGPETESVAVDLSAPGIELVDGAVENFTLAVSAAFSLKTLNFKPAGTIGFRYQRATAELDIFGGVSIQVAENLIGFTLGTSFVNPGLRLQNGVISYASAALNTDFQVGDLRLKTSYTGFTYDGADDSWAIFGSATILNIFSATVGLGDPSNPGLRIRNNDWSIHNLTLGLANVDLGAFTLEEAKLTISRTAQSWSVYAACGVVLPVNGGVGARGEFALVDGKVDFISVTFASAAGIPIPNTPLAINYISGSIRNLSNLSQITLTGSMGIGVGSTVHVRDQTAVLAQFVGSFTLDPNSLKMQVNAYLGAINTGTMTQPQWNGLLAEGTGIVFLDWSQGAYYADLNLSFLSGVFVVGGRVSMSAADGLVLRSTAKLQVPRDIVLIGGTTLAAADFLFVYNPLRNEFFAMAWGKIFLLGTRGIRYDVNTDRFDLLNGDKIQGDLTSTNQQVSVAPLAVSSSFTATALPALVSTTVLSQKSRPLALADGMRSWDSSRTQYSGRSLPVPETDVTDGIYLVRFKVRNPARWSTAARWQKRLRFIVDPVPGVKFEPLAFQFNATTGLGTIGVRVVPLPGQYLPQGLSLTARLTSPVRLSGPGGSRAPALESTWNQAHAYAGITPVVGSGTQGPPPPGLQVRQGRFTISFQPVADPGHGLPADWLDSLRLDLEPVQGITFEVRQPFFDQKTGVGSILILTSKTDGSFLDPGVQFQGVLRSKVGLRSPQDSSSGGPVLGIHWVTDPSVVDRPSIASSIRPGVQTTHLTGHVNDPRLKQILVSLFYSTDLEGNQEYVATLADLHSPAESIPVPVNADGTWSVDIRWDALSLPEGNLWLYGMASDGPAQTPVYGESAGPFEVVHDIQGRVDLHGSLVQNTLVTAVDTAIGYSGMPVFMDINLDGQWQSGEPRSITNEHGDFTLDAPAGLSAVTLVYALPEYLRAGDGQSARQTIDLSSGPAQTRLAVSPLYPLVRGAVFVTGDIRVDGYNDTLGQPVSGLGVVLTGPNGIVLRGSTNNRGEYELPVELPGKYTLSLDLENAQFLDSKLAEASGQPTRVGLTVSADASTIVSQAPLRVDAIGVVNRADPAGVGSLAERVEMSNWGYLSVITFDERLRGATLDIKLPTETEAQPYYIWNSRAKDWTLVTPPASLTTQYGPSAFVLSGDLVLDGKDLGIILREGGGTAGDPMQGFRAFHVLPGVEFLLKGITLNGFTARGADLVGAEQPRSSLAAAGSGKAGLGGAILNRGRTQLEGVTLMGNSAVGSPGGDVSVPVYGALQTSGHRSQAGVPVTLTYTVGADPALHTATVQIATAGAGGLGLGGAIYNAPGASLSVLEGSRFLQNTANGGPQGKTPAFLTNLANTLFGDSAHTISVRGLKKALKQASAKAGFGQGGAIFNDGGSVQISRSVLDQNSSSSAGAAFYARGGKTVIDTSVFTHNSSPGDQGIHEQARSNKNASLKIDRSSVLGHPGGPRALVARGISSSGTRNVIRPMAR